MEDSMIDRAAARVVPRDPITVGVEAGDRLVAFGVVANISKLGACVLTDFDFRSEAPLSFCLSFPREAQPLSAPGRVVWLRGEGSADVRCGLEFVGLPERDEVRLRGLIGRAELGH